MGFLTNKYVREGIMCVMCHIFFPTPVELRKDRHQINTRSRQLNASVCLQIKRGNPVLFYQPIQT
jgi:hypothetical protein